MHDKIDCCLQSIFESDANKDEYEVIVCDSSDDESQTLLNKYAKLHSNLKLITNKTKLSTGYARNLAVQHAVGEYIYMLDIDDKLYDNTVLSKILS
jgi:glycosyltransferase involved in cell wall biosynthesis